MSLRGRDSQKHIEEAATAKLDVVVKAQRASVCSAVSVIQMDAEIDQQSFIHCCDQSTDFA